MGKVHTGAAGVISSTTGNGAATAIHTLVTKLVAAGWSIYKWSDGTTVVTGSAGFGVAGLSHSNAWVVFTEPGGVGRSYMYQQIQNGGATTTNFNSLFRYSPRLGFVTGGTGSTPPTAADSVDIVSSGTTVFTPSVQLRVHVCASDAAMNGVFSCVMQCYSLGTTTQAGLFVHDCMISGSYDGTDPEPVISYMGTNWGSSTIKFFTGFGTGSQAAATMAAATSQNDFDGAHTVDPTSSKDVAGRMRIFSATTGKGYTNWILLKRSDHVSSSTTRTPSRPAARTKASRSPRALRRSMLAYFSNASQTLNISGSAKASVARPR